MFPVSSPNSFAAIVRLGYSIWVSIHRIGLDLAAALDFLFALVSRSVVYSRSVLPSVDLPGYCCDGHYRYGLLGVFSPGCLTTSPPPIDGLCSFVFVLDLHIPTRFATPRGFTRLDDHPTLSGDRDTQVWDDASNIHFPGPVLPRTRK